MSLGWQTESALLPSKSKPIKVGNKSLIGLKSVLYQQEQQRKLKAASETNDRIKGFKKVQNDFEVNFSKNKKRKEYSSFVEDQVFQKLQGKAKLYDELLEGRAQDLDLNDVSSVANVDFHLKRQKIEEEEETQGIKSDNNNFNDAVEENPRNIIDTIVQSQWQWSKGIQRPNNDNNNHQEEEIDYQRNHQISKQMQAKLQQHIISSPHPKESLMTSSQGLSQAARVKSQWEKCLVGETKQVAENIHQITEQLRSENQQQAKTSTASTIPVTTVTISLREEKLLLLKKKHEKIQQQSAVGKEVG
jgi:hypothetical protein